MPPQYIRVNVRLNGRSWKLHGTGEFYLAVLIKVAALTGESCRPFGLWVVHIPSTGALPVVGDLSLFLAGFPCGQRHTVQSEGITVPVGGIGIICVQGFWLHGSCERLHMWQIYIHTCSVYANQTFEKYGKHCMYRFLILFDIM